MQKLKNFFKIETHKRYQLIFIPNTNPILIFLASRSLFQRKTLAKGKIVLLSLLTQICAIENRAAGCNLLIIHVKEYFRVLKTLPFSHWCIQRENSLFTWYSAWSSKGFLFTFSRIYSALYSNKADLPRLRSYSEYEILGGLGD